MNDERLPQAWVVGPVLYARVPKNACTLINHFLVDLAGTRPTLDASGMDIHRFVERPESGFRPARPADWSNPALFRFTVLRNPYHRLVSAYSNKLAGPRAQESPVFGPLIATVRDSLGAAADPRGGISFAQLLRALVHAGDPPAQPLLDKHLRSQTWFTGTRPDRYQHVGAFERLEDSLQLLEQRFGHSLRRQVFPESKERRRLHKYRPQAVDAPWDWPSTELPNRGLPLPGQFYNDELGALAARRYAADLAFYQAALGRQCTPDGDA